MPSEFHDGMTLGELRPRILELRKTADGCECPACDHKVKEYQRTIHYTMARELIRCYHAAPVEWFHMPTIVGHNGGDITKTRHWGLIEADTTIRREDGGRAGYWRLTEKGRAFVEGRLRVPKYAPTYKHELIGSLYGEPVDIRDCLADKFHYDELMGRSSPVVEPKWYSDARSDEGRMC